MVVFMYLLGIEFPENLMAVKKYLDNKDSTLMNTIKSHLKRSRSSEFGEVMGMKDNMLYFKNMNNVIKRLTFLYKATKGDDMSMETFEETIDNKTPLTVVFDFIFLVCFDFIDQLYRMCTVFLLFLNEPMLAAGYRHLFSMREHLDYELGEFYLIKAEYIEKMELEKARENPLRHNNKYMYARTFVFFLPVLFMCNLHVSPKSFQIEARHCSLAETFVLSPVNSMAEYMNTFSVKDVFKSKKAPMAIALPKYQEQRAQTKYQAPPEPEEEEISVMDLIYNTDDTPFMVYKDSVVETTPQYGTFDKVSVNAQKIKVKKFVCNEVTNKCKMVMVDTDETEVTADFTTASDSDGGKFISAAFSSMYMDRTISLHGIIATVSKLLTGSIRICVKDDCKIYRPKA